MPAPRYGGRPADRISRSHSIDAQREASDTKTDRAPGCQNLPPLAWRATS